MADDARPLLPELTRSLRSLGRPAAETEAAHAAVFAPLLDARARASRGDAADAISALRGAALAARIESLARAAAAAGQGEAARARARGAAARDVLEPLRAELATLDARAPAALQAGAHSAAWEAWVTQLRQVFAAADVACDGLASVLAERVDNAGDARRGWLARRGGRLT